MDEPGNRVILSIRGLEKHFGGVVATDQISLDILQGETHAIIGPNGAGKTTLIAQIAGALKSDAGTILLGGVDITTHSAHARVHEGLARTFQITSIFPDLSVVGNVALAQQAQDGHSFRFWRRASSDERLVVPALACLESVELAHRANDMASSLSHGERRQLEIAMALASDPKLFLLDEPMAGMGLEESAMMIALLKELGTRKTILLVEHDMDAVFALADRISVLVYGRIIATGSPDDIRRNDEVRKAYLGETA